VAGTSLSPGLAAMNDQAAAAGPFAKASVLLEDLAGVSLTAKRVERAAEASGAAAAEAVRERSALIAGRKIVPIPPRQPAPDMLYGVIDCTGVPMTAARTAVKVRSMRGREWSCRWTAMTTPGLLPVSRVPCQLIARWPSTAGLRSDGCGG
jgi:hypothetical protein